MRNSRSESFAGLEAFANFVNAIGKFVIDRFGATAHSSIAVLGDDSFLFRVHYGNKDGSTIADGTHKTSLNEIHQVRYELLSLKEFGDKDLDRHTANIVLKNDRVHTDGSIFNRIGIMAPSQEHAKHIKMLLEELVTASS